jgi:hypothetical protein
MTHNINAYKIASEKVKGIDLLENLPIDGRKIFQLTLRSCGVRLWIGFIWLMIGSYDGLV